ncbi:MAG: penicillin-binding protein [Chitinophagaceae bacterium]
MSDSLHQKIVDIEASRGTIYSADGQMLSTSIPQFDIYIDFGADGLRQKNGKRFRENVDSLSIALAGLFGDASAADYKRMLTTGYRDKNRYFSLKKKLGYRQYQQLKTFPLVRQGRNKSGFIAEVRNIRLNPYEILAYRTIGLDRENSQKVGLEQTYDTILKGLPGRRLVRYIAGGVGVPVDDDANQIDPVNGKDIVTTLDTHIQEITEDALMKMMVGNEAQTGTAIVMEVKTGQIKAIANLGRRDDGNYWEDFNYALTPTEPGSTFKLATMLTLLDDHKITLGQQVNLEGGRWTINKRTVYDSEEHGKYQVTAKQALEMSSNVGMAKMVYEAYSGNPTAYINKLKGLQLDQKTGTDLAGERPPIIFNPRSRYWSATTLPWMAFGYNLLISPMRTTMLYNAVANNGVMMRPYLVNQVTENGTVIKQFEPHIVMDSLGSRYALKGVKECLEGVCNEPNGTGYTLMRDVPFKVAGKTGTALVANGTRGYADKVYQSSFAGYFPADNPQYTCVVVIVNKPHAAKFYGASVAGPVFKEIAERLYTLYVKNEGTSKPSYYNLKKDTTGYAYEAYAKDVQTIMNGLGMNYQYKGAGDGNWWNVYSENQQPTVSKMTFETLKKMPKVTGMSLKDAVYVCENAGLQVRVTGRGRVSDQSINSGEPISHGQLIHLNLN